MRGVGFVFLLLLTTISYADDQGAYNFPFKDRYLATILAKADHAEVPLRTTTIKVRNDRAQVPGFKNPDQLTIGLFLHPAGEARPLVFVIAGTGGTALSSNVQQLASEIYAAGLNAVSLPNPVSEDYVLAVSDTALPGYMPRDTNEYYELLKLVDQKLKTDERLTISKYMVASYSLGGLLTARLVQLDQEQKAFQFNKAVILNPAIDLLYGVAVLDGFYKEGEHVSLGRKAVTAVTMDAAIHMIIHGASDSRINQMVRGAGIDDTELKWLIGEAFRSKLAKVIFASQQVRDLGLVMPADRSKVKARKKSAGQFTFAQYMTKFVLPSVSADSSTYSDLIKSSDIYRLVDELKDNTHIYVLENADDILVQRGDVEFFQATLGGRFKVYPYGGHVGNLRFKQNRDDLAAIFKAD